MLHCRTRLTLVAFALLLSIAFSPGIVQAVSLEELLADPSSGLQVGDKFFDQFSYSWTGDMPAAGDVMIEPITNDPPAYGIKVLGDFRDEPGNNASDAVLRYRVTVTDPNFEIIGAQIAGDPEVSGGSGAASVTETFLSSQGDVLAIFKIEPGQVQTEDMIAFADAVVQLQVQKDILANASGGQSATISFIDQKFPQVPEPSAMLLLAVGMVGLVVTRVRR